MTRQEVLDAYMNLPDGLKNTLYDSCIIAICRSAGNESISLRMLENYINKNKVDIEC